MPFMPTKEAKIRYRTRAIPALLLMFGASYWANRVSEHGHAGKPLAIAVAVSLWLSIMLLVTLVIQFLNADRDEVQLAYRRHAVAWASGGLLATCLFWNGLEMFELAPKVSAGTAVPVFLAYLMVAGIALKGRYQ